MTKTKSRKLKYFDRFYNQKDFFSSDIEPELFNNMHHPISWYDAKLLLRHKSCTHQFRMNFINNGVWYERLVACLAKPARSQYAVYAMKDPDSRVRRAVFLKSLPEEVITSLEAALLVQSAKEILSAPPHQRAWTQEMFRYADTFQIEYDRALKSPALGLLSPNEDIRRITKEKVNEILLRKV